MYRVPFAFTELAFDAAVALAADTGVVSGAMGPLLETVVDMLDELSRPDSCFDCIQIAGTNGKTSTSRFVAAILNGEGLKCALYTSPQLVRYPERMEICGQVVSDEQFAHGVSAALEAGKRVNARRAAAGEGAYTITPFDLLTVAALVVFAEAGVDVAVLEVGMGGRWDATSATEPKVVAITGIGLDHMRILGSTVAEIAAEKAAVIKPGRRVVLGEGLADPSVDSVICEACAKAKVRPFRVHHDVISEPDGLGRPFVFGCPVLYSCYILNLVKPTYQAQNVACAIAVAESYLLHELDPDKLEASLNACPTPGRFDIVQTSPLVMVDACHNPQSCEAFVESVRAVEPSFLKRPVLLIAALSDKDVSGIVDVLVPAFPQVAVTKTKSKRALSTEELAGLVQAKLAEQGRKATDLIGTYESVEEALASIKEPLVAAGTITLAGEVSAALKSE